jgi:hypothetical protein
VSSYEYAKVILRREREREQRRLEAAQTDVDLYSARIEYDEANDHSDERDVPEFKRKREEAEKHMEEHRLDILALDAALARLETPEPNDD